MKHAKLGASSSSRWLNCPGSVRMCEGSPNTSSVFAAEGTTAHAVGEEALRDKRPASFFVGKVMEGIPVDHTMADYVQRYVNYVNDLVTDESTLLVEQRVPYTDWVPEGFGTADAIVVTGTHVDVCDLKYGKGVEVNAEKNSQGMLYALGVFQLYDHIYEFETVAIHIIQPRIGNYSEWRITRDELLDFGDYVISRAQLCFTDNAPLNPSENACRWCLAVPTCKALADHNLAVIGAEFDTLDDIEQPNADKLTVEQVAKLLPNVSLITNWLKSVNEHALESTLNGQTIPGYKAVAGRSIRRWADNMEPESLPLTGDQLYTKKLISPAQAEKIVGKGKLDNLIVKPEGKPTLVPVTDKRKPIEKTVDSFDDLT